MVSGRSYQLSDLYMHHTVVASQIRDGLFNFWGHGGLDLKNMCLLY